MFKVPDWADDIPKNNASFERKAKKKEKAQLVQKTKLIKPKVTNIVAKKKLNSIPKLNKHTPRVNNYTARVNTTNKVNKATTRVNKPFPRVNSPTPKISHSNKKNRNPKYGQTDKNTGKASRKRKIENTPSKTKQHTMKSNKIVEEAQMLTTDVPDEVIINAKKRKLNKALKSDDRQDLQLKETRKMVKKSALNTDDSGFTQNGSDKVNHKKEKLKKLLANRTPVNVNGNKLRQRMLERLKAAQFRYLNEKLYTSSGSEAQELFQSDPSAFQTYHQGYQLQVKKWPINPLDVIVKKIMKMPKTHTIADMGCGEAALRRRVAQTVRSFDLVATAEGVEECDMAHTPLLTSSVDAAVYCLALMGTQLTQYLVEANRVLKMGGHLLIAEVESRFENVETFTQDVQRLGFKLKNLDKTHKVFFFMEFVKIREPPAKKAKLPDLTLKPCLYKRR